jgi:hypothetical protein
MAQIAKILRWFFGLNALMFAAMGGRFLWAFPPFITHSWTGSAGMIVQLLAYLGAAAIFGMACWKLGEGSEAGRRWALAASGINITFYWMVHPAWMWSVAGVVGVLIFRRQRTVEEMAAKMPRVRGDGTSSTVDLIANVAMICGFLVGCLFWAAWGARHRLPDDASVSTRLLSMEIAALLTTLFHEAGHVMGARFMNMELRRFVVGPIEGFFRSGKWAFRFYPPGLLGAPGSVGVVPASMEKLRERHAVVAAAGPLASLLLGLGTLWATLSAKGSPWEPEWRVLAFTATFSLLCFLFNAIPMRPGSMYSDGARIYQLLGRGPWADVHLALSMGSCTLASPMRPRDVDIEVVRRAMAFLTRGTEALLLRVQAKDYFHDCGRVPEALQALEDAERVYADSAPNLRADLHKSFVFANAFLKRDRSAARLWWQRMEAKQGATVDAEYWMSYSALLWSEERSEEGRAAWEKSEALMRDGAPVGAFEYDRDCLAQLRAALDAGCQVPMSA